MFSHAAFPADTASVIALNASLYPWSDAGVPDQVSYRVDLGARLISLAGGMQVSGKALSLWNSPQQTSHFGEFWCIGSSRGWPTCPSAGSEVKVAASTFSVPAAHSGEVFFTAKLRMQGDASDGGGNVLLYLKIDGSLVGGYGVQGVTPYDGESQRTLSTSYYSAGPRRLAAGSHTVEAWAQAEGDFLHMTVSADLPLIYFD